MNTFKTIMLLIFITILGSCNSKEYNITQNWKQIPVLKFKTQNPILQFKLDSIEYNNANKVVIDISTSTDIKDIKKIDLIPMGSDSTWKINNGIQIVSGEITKETATFDISNIKISQNSYFIVALELVDQAQLQNKISANVLQLYVNNKKLNIQSNPNKIKQRIGVAVRKANDDNVVGYRIPGLAITKKGTLLGIYDARRETRRDLQGHIDIGVSRSTDNGHTWEPMRIGLDMGEYGGLPQKFNGVSDASILIDQNSETIFLAGCWMHGVVDGKTGKVQTELTEESNNWNHQWRNYGSLQGFDINKTSQFIIAKSTDDGKTWSNPINITKQIKKPDWHLFAPAPGSGITLSDGTLVFPTQGKDKNQTPFSNITYSKDGGITWQSSEPSYINTTESMVVQLSNGDIMQNMRDNRNHSDKSESNGRAIFTTSNLGKTWTEHSTSHGALIEPTCMASLYKHNYTDKNGSKKSILLFSNPNSKHSRSKMTIKVSFDDGKTWPEDNWLLLDEFSLMGGYSSLTSVNDSTIGILYEGSQAQMTFESISLSELKVE